MTNLSCALAATFCCPLSTKSCLIISTSSRADGAILAASIVAQGPAGLTPQLHGNLAITKTQDVNTKLDNSFVPIPRDVRSICACRMTTFYPYLFNLESRHSGLAFHTI